MVVEESYAPSVLYYLDILGLNILTEGRYVHSETVIVISSIATIEESTIP